MKHKAGAIPNHSLRRERELRGWSQQELAERIGAPSSYYISRWERGVILPSPHYREKLCEIFSKSADELGLLVENTAEAHQSVAPALIDAPTEYDVSWNIPYPRNPLFTGREQVLIELHDAFQAAQADDRPAIQALSGLGGIGKTQTALEYAYRFRTEYKAVFWMQAETAEVLLSDVISIAQHLNFSVEKGQEEKYLELLKRWLNGRASYLLVLDNVTNLADVQKLLSATYNGHILLTTRLQATRQLARCVELDPLSLEEGIQFLLHRTGNVRRDRARGSVSSTDDDPTIAAIEALANLVDGLPLALDQAGAYIEETGCSFTDYLEYYRRYRSELLARRGESIMDHAHSVSATFSLIFETIQRHQPVAAQLLCLCAFLYPDAIPEELLRSGMMLLPDISQAIAQDPFTFDAASQALRAASLIRRNSETKMLTIHRLVQAVMKDSLSTDEQRRWANLVVSMTSRALPDPEEYNTWQQFQRLFLQAQACVALVRLWELVSHEAAQLLHHTSTYSWMRGQWHQVEELLQQELTVLTRLHGMEDTRVAMCLNNFGVFYQYQKRYDRAEECYLQALTIRENLCGAEHLDTAETLDNLAYCYMLREDYEDAEAPAQRAVAIRRKQLGATHSIVARSLHTIGRLYLTQQTRYDDAELYLNEALTIREQHRDSSPHLLAQTLTEKASLYLKQQRYAESETLFLRALDIYEQAVGNEHPAVATVLRKYGELLSAQGREQKAREVHRRVLQIELSS